jgi:hypothetical protein
MEAPTRRPSPDNINLRTPSTYFRVDPTPILSSSTDPIDVAGSVNRGGATPPTSPGWLWCRRHLRRPQ